MEIQQSKNSMDDDHEAVATLQCDADKDGSPGLLQLRIPLPASQIEVGKLEERKRTLQIFILDKSGSMAGSPWLKLQKAVRYIKDNGGDVEVRYIVFDSLAKLATAEQVMEMRAGGGTNFLSAFATLKECIQSNNNMKNFVITFMTDGEHNGDTLELNQAIDELKTFLGHKTEACTVVHTLGFGRGSSLQVLDQIRLCGSQEGYYRYSDTSYGSLDEKFEELFDLGAVPSIELACDLGSGANTVKGVVHDNGMAVVEEWTNVKPNLVKVFFPDGEIALPVKTIPADLLFSIKCIERELQELGLEKFDKAEDFQKRLNDINVFTAPKSIRQEVFEARTTVQAHLDSCHKARAESSRAGVSAISADLRYAAHFSKARRNRAMYLRTVKNAEYMKHIQDRLDSNVKIDPSALQDINMEHYCCDVSHRDLKEVLEEGDLLGFGIAVSERTEYMIDAPTELRVSSFGVTMISKQTFEDAVKYKIPLEGAEAVHGGFMSTPSAKSWDEEIELPSALSGRAREPINAWLPLYVCREHYERVKIMLRPILGYLFTLDPLGYKDDQLLALYTILGHMHANFGVQVDNSSSEVQTQKEPSERQMMLLQDYRKFCAALLPYVERKLSYSPLEKFISSFAGRTKAAVSNLMTIIGWASALGDVGLIASLRQPLIEELIRRQISKHVNCFSLDQIKDHLKMLLYGSSQSRISTSKINLERIDTCFSKDADFADYARYYVGESNERCSAPEFETIPEEALSDLQWDPSYTDSEVQKVTKELHDAVKLGYLERAIKLPRIESEIFWKAVYVYSLTYYTNALCNEAIAANKEVQLVADDPVKILTDAHTILQKEREQLLRKQRNLLIAKCRAFVLINTQDIWSFCGRLLVASPRRGGDAFNMLVEMLKKPPITPVPLHKEKLSLIMLGRLISKSSETAEHGLAEYPIISNGEAWNVPPRIRRKLARALGEEAMAEIVSEMQGRSAKHVYRGWPNDIPNRHGFCNSRPSKWGTGGVTERKKKKLTAHNTSK
eukprot:c28318_g1_i2 orf=144-3185(+)